MGVTVGALLKEGSQPLLLSFIIMFLFGFWLYIFFAPWGSIPLAPANLNKPIV